MNWKTARLLSDALDNPRSSHEEVESPEYIVVVRDDSAHPVQNFTDRDDAEPENEHGIWVKVAECNSELHAIKIAVLLSSHG